MLLKNILFVVEDIERSKQFYEDILDLKVTADFGEKVMFAGGLVLEEREYWENALHILVGFGGRDAELYFETSDIDALKARLEGSEYEAGFLPGEDEAETETIRFYDPDRHVIEVKRACVPLSDEGKNGE